MQDNVYYNFYSLAKDREEEIWKNCIFAFDTSALLALYYFSQKSQQEIFKNTFSKIENRLWVAGHAKYEYLKNRESIMKKPIDEKYMALENNQIKNLEGKIKQLSNIFTDFRQHTQKTDTHPYIDSSICDQFSNVVDTVTDAFRDFKTKVKDEFSKRITEIESFVQRDTVQEAINNYFQVGREYSFDEVMEIVTEGEQRYRLKIPPGFQDFSQKEGIQKFGDLIVWKQILELATEKQLPIILVTNDVKSDWCYADRSNREARIKQPKEDLITEMKDKAGVPFWMYTLAQFLYAAKQYLGASITEAVIEEARVGAQQSSEVLKYYTVRYLRDELVGVAVRLLLKNPDHTLEETVECLRTYCDRYGLLSPSDYSANQIASIARTWVEKRLTALDLISNYKVNVDYLDLGKMQETFQYALDTLSGMKVAPDQVKIEMNGKTSVRIIIENVTSFAFRDSHFIEMAHGLQLDGLDFRGWSVGFREYAPN